MFAGEPEHVGIEKKKEDEADGEEIHVEAEENSGMEEVPLRTSHAAEGIEAADGCDDCREDEKEVCPVVGESGEQIGHPEAEKHKYVASQQGPPLRIEDAGYHALPIAKDRIWGFGGVFRRMKGLNKAAEKSVAAIKERPGAKALC